MFRDRQDRHSCKFKAPLLSAAENDTEPGKKLRINDFLILNCKHRN